MNRGNSTDAYRWSQAVFANVYEGWESNLGRSSVEAGLACLLGASGALGYERSAEFASEALGSLPPDHVIRPFAQMLAGWMQALGGDWEAGVDNLRRAAQLARARGLAGTEVEAESLLATVLLSRGDIRGAEPLVRESLDAWEQRGISHSLATRALLIGPATLIAARAGQIELARTRLAQADQFASAFGPMLPWLPVVIESFSAAAHMHLGDHERAGQHLQRATESARTVQSSPMLDELLTAARDTVEGGLHLSELSPAERRVWELLQTRATLREIADALFVSPETVKTQTGSIYRKLGISSRREAQEIGDRLPPLASSDYR